MVYMLYRDFSDVWRIRNYTLVTYVRTYVPTGTFLSNVDGDAWCLLGAVAGIVTGGALLPPGGKRLLSSPSRGTEPRSPGRARLATRLQKRLLAAGIPASSSSSGTQQDQRLC